MRLALILNRSAGTMRRLSPQETLQALVHCFGQAGHEVLGELCDRRQLAARLSAMAMDKSIDLVVVGGGDGTFLTAILAGLGIRKPLGLLPLGTLNLLARDLGLPTDPLAAAMALAQGKVDSIDLAEVNGYPFAIWASLGLHPVIVRQRDKLQRIGLGKWWAFALAALRALRRYPLIDVTISLEGESRSFTTPMLVISNNAWRDEPPPLRRQALDRGELEVHVAKAGTRWDLIRLVFAAALGSWRTEHLIQTYRTREVRVTSRKKRAIVSLDGEVTVLRSPMVFRCRPKALSMLIPASPQDPP